MRRISSRVNVLELITKLSALDPAMQVIHQDDSGISEIDATITTLTKRIRFSGNPDLKTGDKALELRGYDGDTDRDSVFWGPK